MGREELRIQTLIQQDLVESIRDLLINTKNTTDLLKVLLEIILQTHKCEAGAIILLDSKHHVLHFKTASGEKQHEIQKLELCEGQGFAGWVISHNTPILSNEPANDPRWCRSISARVQFETRNIVCCPLRFHNRTIGALQLINKISEPFTEADVESLLQIGPEIALSLHHLQILENTFEKNARFEQIMKTSQLLTTTFKVDTVLKESMDMILNIIEAEGCSLFTYEIDGFLHLQIAKNRAALKQPLPEANFRLKVGQGIAGEVAEERKPMLIPDAQNDSRFDTRMDNALGYKTRTIMCVPMLVQDRLIGVIEAINKQTNTQFTLQDLEYFQLLANHIAVALENASLVERLQDWNDTLQESVNERTQELQSACTKLQKMDQMKTDFLNVVAHDIRNPLTSILAFSQLIQATGQNLNEMQSEGLTTIVTEVKRLNGLIDDLLSFAKMESGTLEWGHNPVNMTQIIHHLKAVFEPDARQRKVSLIAELPEGDITLTGDQSKLSQVIANLIGNALKFTPAQGTVRIQAREITLKGKACWQFKVSDTGCGIPKKDLKKIFEKFGQSSSRETKQTKGSGLGLYICQLVVTHHQGRIYVESKRHQGSTFIVELPQ